MDNLEVVLLEVDIIEKMYLQDDCFNEIKQLSYVSKIYNEEFDTISNTLDVIERVVGSINKENINEAYFISILEYASSIESRCISGRAYFDFLMFKLYILEDGYKTGSEKIDYLLNILSSLTDDDVYIKIGVLNKLLMLYSRVIPINIKTLLDYKEELKGLIDKRGR